MKLLVTGCASRLARACLPVLLDDPRISHITGIDVKPSELQHNKFSANTADIRHGDLTQYLTAVDAVLHLAFVVDSGGLNDQRMDREYIRSINVAGTKNVFEQAVAHQIHTHVYLSSGIVYGLKAENPAFLDESRPLNAVENFYFSQDKVAVENWLDQFESQHSNTRIVRLRPHVILGEHTRPLIKSLLRPPVYVSLPDPQPLTHCISEMDVASAILQSLFSEVHGSYNLATDQVVSLHLIQQHLHKLALPVPYALVKRAQQLAWRYSGRYGDPGWMNCLSYPLTLDNEKAKRELHWKPTLDVFECLAFAV